MICNKSFFRTAKCRYPKPISSQIQQKLFSAEILNDTNLYHEFSTSCTICTICLWKTMNVSLPWGPTGDYRILIDYWSHRRKKILEIESQEWYSGRQLLGMHNLLMQCPLLKITCQNASLGYFREIVLTWSFTCGPFCVYSRAYKNIIFLMQTCIHWARQFL